MRISDWSSDVCSSDLHRDPPPILRHRPGPAPATAHDRHRGLHLDLHLELAVPRPDDLEAGRAEPPRCTFAHRGLLLNLCPSNSHDIPGGQIGRAACRARGYQTCKITWAAVPIK